MFPAPFAVDGVREPGNMAMCAHPHNPSGGPAWWQVDLGREYSISEVTIYNRDDHCDGCRCK